MRKLPGPTHRSSGDKFQGWNVSSWHWLTPAVTLWHWSCPTDRHPPSGTTGRHWDQCPREDRPNLKQQIHYSLNLQHTEIHAVIFTVQKDSDLQVPDCSTRHIIPASDPGICVGGGGVASFSLPSPFPLPPLSFPCPPSPPLPPPPSP